MSSYIIRHLEPEKACRLKERELTKRERDILFNKIRVDSYRSLMNLVRHLKSQNHHVEIEEVECS